MTSVSSHVLPVIKREYDGKVESIAILLLCTCNHPSCLQNIYTVFQKSDGKIQITITTAYLIRIKYPLSGFNYHLSDVNVANFNKIHCIVSKQQLF